MAQEVTNFARFYTLFNKLPCTGDREEFKKSIVLQYTWNRTDSLKEMTAKEYEACCTALEKLSGQDEWRQKLREELRRKRSLCLNHKRSYRFSSDKSGRKGCDSTDL